MKTEPPPPNKVKKLLLVTVGLIGWSQWVGASGASDVFFQSPSFWVSKPKLQARLRDERAVIVSVKSESAKPKDRFSIQGVGWVRRDGKTAFQLAKDFERLKEISDHFRDVKSEAATGRVFVICQALGYQARMLFRVQMIEAQGQDPVLKFEVIDGHFLGLQGQLKFRDIAEKERGPAGTSDPISEVSLRIFHEASEIPIPRILVGVALEFLVQRVAVKMRSHFETATLAPSGSRRAD